MRGVATPVRTAHELTPDRGRIVARPYMPAGEISDPEPRAARLVRRVLTLPADEIEGRLANVVRDFSGRHRDLESILAQSYRRVAHHVNGSAPSPPAQLLIGAYATHEFAIEAAGLFNPSMVLAPDQSGTQPGESRFIMSVRAVGEGHLSCIEFRTGLVRRDGDVRFDTTSPYASTGTISSPEYDRVAFGTKLVELRADRELTRRLVEPLGARFDLDDLQRQIAGLASAGVSRATAYKTVQLARMLALSNYVVRYPDDIPISERVLFPNGPTESRGMEDARFLRFTDGDSVTYYATYTAFDGADILPQLIQTDDFATFRIATLNGPYARNKGMALFPRRIDGQFAALSRYDQENIDLMLSDDVRMWRQRDRLRTPEEAWEFVQIGNCGSPLETEAGWLVLTHGVGPMRTYAIGALLLDRDDPQRVIGALDEPLLAPDERERNGYVPNVLYSCGGMLHDGLLVLPYGFSDSGIRIALVELDPLLERLARP